MVVAHFCASKMLCIGSFFKVMTLSQHLSTEKQRNVNPCTVTAPTLQGLTAVFLSRSRDQETLPDL